MLKKLGPNLFPIKSCFSRLQRLVPKDVKEAIQHAQSAMRREPGLRSDEAHEKSSKSLQRRLVALLKPANRERFERWRCTKRGRQR